MKRISYLILTICTSLALVGCVDDNIMDKNATTSPFDESDIIDTKLAVSVNDFLVSVNGTRADDDEDHEEPTADAEEIMSDFEKTIDNIWVFQYDADGNLLIRPRYYTAAESQNYDSSWDVVLKPVESTIYVVTNVNRDTWASEYNDFMTIDNGLLKQSLPFPEPITDTSDEATTGHIPMKGCTAEATTPGGMDNIVVPVEHMYAKVKMRVLLDNDLDAYYAYINSVSFSNIPWYCRVGTLYDETAASKDNEYPTHSQQGSGEGVVWFTRSFTEPNNTDDPYNDQFEEGFTYDYVIYVPENIQGEVANKTDTDKDDKGTEAPEHACTMTVDIGYVDEGGVQESAKYTVYPGGNEYNNYNIRRNQVYRVTVEIGYPINSDNSPSANCIVGHPSTTFFFEPYYRIEEGGGYQFSDYVKYDDIKGLKILWQTKDCIGNNSDGTKLRIENNEIEQIYSKIYVTVDQPGNAVIAAYANEDCTGDIIWSWHIWVTEEDPTNIGNAIVYYTYQWDEEDIYGAYSDVARVPGYGCMPCNLGALVSEPVDDNVTNKVQSYGLVYQWGRKDPFPGLKGSAATEDKDACIAYNETTAEQLYDNEHNEITGMTEGTDEGKLFHSMTADVTSTNHYGIEYTIKNPTVFMCGTKQAGQKTSGYVGASSGDSYATFIQNYVFNGGWMEDQPNNLWGGEDVTADMKCLVVGKDKNTSEDVHLYDDYGSKSIFDPCPYGWRVSPPDQWLGFTDTGYNPSSWSQVNTPSASATEANMGMYLYIQAWKSGITTWFPTQGTRVPDGSGCRPRRCGNYHNATADSDDGRVNILHIHNGSSNFNIFEYTRFAYHVKATAGPIRCVRDTK